MNAYASLQTELAILGTAMNDPACASRLAALPEDAFTAPQHSAMHRAIKRLVSRGASIDVVTVADEAKGDMDDAALIVQAAADGYMTSSYGSYEAILSEARKRRIACQVGTTLATDSANPGSSIDALVGDAVKALQTSETGQGSTVDMQGALIKFLDDLDNAQQGRCNTGIADLDWLTGGLRGGKLVILGARPKTGKTALALYMATHVAQHTGPVLFASLEMDESEIMARIVAAKAGVDLSKIDSGRLSDDESARMAQCYQEISQIPLHINADVYTPLQIRAAATRLKAEKGLAMIVVDYLQLMRADHKTNSLYEKASECSNELKRMAKQLGVPVLALTQFNRESEKSPFGKKQERAPTPAESRDSGSIEQDANLFLIQYTPPAPDAANPGDPVWNGFHACQMNGTTYQNLIVAMNRQGPTGVIHLSFDKPKMQFRSIDLRRQTQ